MNCYKERNNIYPILKTRRLSRKFRQELKVPVVNIIRHGETQRKQLQQGALKSELSIENEGFALCSKYLDLTDEGIETIQRTTAQLLERIDKPKEVVLVVSSKSWRAHSSALLIEEGLRASGVVVLNKHRELRFFSALHENAFHALKFKASGEDYADSHEFFEIVDGTEALNSQRFLRHMNNIYFWLSAQTKHRLKGKRLRIVCATHQEIMMEFVSRCFGWVAPQGKGQILEIAPRSNLKMDGQVKTVVELLPNRQRPNGFKVEVMRGFTIRRKDETIEKSD